MMLSLLIAYSQWCDDDTLVAAVLTTSVLFQFASEFIGLGTVSEMWDHLCQRYQLVTLSGSMLFSGGLHD
jgi:hypothetical protein